MPEPSRSVVAAFDVDGTLTTRDCVVPFLRRHSSLLGLAAALLRRPMAAASAAIRRDRDALKALAVTVFRNVAGDAADRDGAAFAATVQQGWLRSDTPQRLAWHRAQGHRIVLVSASLDPYLRPLGAALGVDAVLCTQLERNADGVLTGRLHGANCRGAEKVRRLRQWLADEHYDDAEVWAYGDSAGDRELLAFAGRRGFLVKDVDVPAEPPVAAT